mmetsp:Transcript_15662/g.49019  ORF Transcript_15662/g.49019 Transcript_15662/m.49019 type:complete len:520 (-) Transcript_15662:432-1991(-)
MRVGSKAASAFEGVLGAEVLPSEARKVYETEEEIREAEWRSMGMSDEEKGEFWKEVKRVSLSRRAVYERARANRYERELYARFGMFKGVATQPWAMAALRWLDDCSRIRLVGDPVLNAHSCVIVLFMAWRGRMPADKFVLLACFLFAVHPVVVVAFAATFAIARGRKRRPKRPAGPIEIRDGGLQGLYTGALLAAAGARVTVHEPGDCFVSSPRFGQMSRYETVLAAAARGLAFEPVGTPETGWAYAVSNVVLRAGAEHWVEAAREVTGFERERLSSLARRASQVAADLFAFTASQLEADDQWIFRSATEEAGATFRVAANASVDDALARLGFDDETGRARLVELVGTSATNFANWCWLLTHTIDGFHLAPGLADAMTETVLAAGGAVRFASGGETRKVLKLTFPGEYDDLPFTLALKVDDLPCCFYRRDDAVDCLVESTLPLSAVLDRLHHNFDCLRDKPHTHLYLKIFKYDSFLHSAAPRVVNGWLAAHKHLRYTKADVLVFRRNLVNELKNIPRRD